LVQILFGALHWLDENWPTRRSKVLKVLKYIRFGYLSPQILRDLRSSDFQKFGPVRRVLEEFRQLPESRYLIDDGIFYSAVVLTGDLDGIKQHPYYKNYLTIPRRWMQDIRCKYHCPVTERKPNMYFIHYDSFVEYSKILEAGNSHYEDHFKYATEEENLPKHELNVTFNFDEANDEEICSNLSTCTLGSEY